MQFQTGRRFETIRRGRRTNNDNRGAASRTLAVDRGYNKKQLEICSIIGGKVKIETNLDSARAR